MSRVGTTHPLARGWMGLLLPVVIGSVSCDRTDPTTNGSTGGLTLVTSTAGIQPDDDGYTIMLDGKAQGTIGPNDRQTVLGIDQGSHAVELSNIEFNCATLGQFTQTVSVASDTDAVVEYSVACDAVSRSRIAFVRDRDLAQAEVMVMNADGSDVSSLKDSLGAVHPPGMLLPPVSWSADGNRVAFTRADGGLYATTGVGTEVVQLAPAGTSPLWSEDGRKVAFLAAEPGTEVCCWDIFVAESDGSAVAQVTDGLTLLDYDFAANGSLLVYAEPNENYTDYALVVIRPDGTGRRELPTPGVCCLRLPRLSPDGSKVAYAAYPDDQVANGPGNEIYVSPTDGSGAAIAVSNNPGDDFWPVWSPDGARIAFVSDPAGTSFSPGRLRVVNADGTGQIDLTPDESVWEPVWSPDGTRIAYSGSVGHVFVANADGSGRTELTPNMNSSRPTWTGR
jgi:Tol biopolymer transport system component